MTVRLLLRVMWVPLVALTVSVAVIRAQPYTPPEGLDAILPPACERACLMGIIPGETTIDEAVAMLQAHPYVDPNWINHIEPLRTTTWTWGETVPRLIVHATGGGRVHYDAYGTVSEMYVYMSMPLGETRLSFGTPDVLYQQVDGDGSWFLDYDVDTARFIRHTPGICRHGLRQETPFVPGITLITIRSESDLYIGGLPPVPRPSNREGIPCMG
ncbi:MAG: hypothetical protein AAF125_07200 [Chloroflexota bacterium]